jgi:phosphohistidine phosphatase
MKTLLILRHAKSSWDDPSLPDHDRPLNKRGLRDAPRMGLLIRDQDLTPDLIVSSTALRARTTAEIVAEVSGCENEVLLTADLYQASPDGYIAVLQGLSPDIETAMVVGHNPCLEDLLDDLTDESERLPTCALAHVLLPIDDWSALDLDSRCELKNIWLPKELGS